MQDAELTVFTELKLAVKVAMAAEGLPLWLFPPISQIIDHPERFAENMALVQQLLEQVRGYDPYAGAGCFSEAFSVQDIQATLSRLGFSEGGE